ncbi:MAG: type II toxin-antitoxin system VapC family toxin [Desulfobacteraceae bacterium]|jgi:PIN domain nuclease of toxin-antitoxin system
MIILDTHVWWWALSEPERLSDNAKNAILTTRPGERAICSISIWEMAMMISRGRVKIDLSPDEWMDYAVKRTGLQLLELSGEIALESCRLPDDFHKDPADRIIAATTRIHKAILVTRDQKLMDSPHVETLW